MRARLHDLPARIRRRLTSERGFAVPTVLLMTVAAMGIASVGVITSIRGQRGSVRDENSKSALAVAESGVSQALLYYNSAQIPAECASVPEGSWCGPIDGVDDLAGVATYYTKLDGGELQVVSLGTSNGVARRVEITANSSSGQSIFLDAAVQSKDGLVLDSNSKIHSGVATNGSINLSSNAKQCGVASVGIGEELTTNGNAAYYNDTECTSPETDVLEGEISLPPVNQGDATTNNDNDRFFGQDPISGNKAAACWNGTDGKGKSGSCGARELLVEHNSSVTMGGSVYSLCQLKLKQNSALYVQPSSPGATTYIYFDSPEACGYSSGAVQLDLQSNSRITSANGDPTNVAMLFVGSTSLSTEAHLNSNTAVDGPCEQNFVIYGPYTDVELDSNSRFCGAVAGKHIHLDSNAEIWTGSGTSSFVLPNTDPHYQVERFVDCSVEIGSPPDAGC